MSAEKTAQIVEEPSTSSEKISKLDSVRESLGTNKMKDNKQKGLMALGIIGALVLVLGVLYFVSNGNSFRSPLGAGGSLLSSGDAFVNPLNGILVSGNKADAMRGTRPLAIMVNNHADARPQSGLIYADLVYEIVAEGGITRLLPFYLSEIPDKIGPVRSTREYYLVLVKELGDAMLMHIGWSPQALAAIESWPVRSLGRGGAEFWRDNPRNVATEHTAYVDGKYLMDFSKVLGWEGTREFRVWEFKDSRSGYESYSDASNIAIDFWTKGEYSAIFEYNAEKNQYNRFMGYDGAGNPIPHVDQETNEQITVTNLVVQFVPESGIVGDDAGRLDYALVGSGSGIVFIDGKAINVTWSKEARDERTLFFDSNGEEIKFNRGTVWISIVPDRNVSQVVYN